MNALDMVFAAVALGNKEKGELNSKNQKYLEIFREKDLENEYQSHVNSMHEKEVKIAEFVI